MDNGSYPGQPRAHNNPYRRSIMKYRHTRIIAIGITAVLETAGMSDVFAQDHQDIINAIRDFLPQAWNSIIIFPNERFEPNVPEPVFESVIDRETNLTWERVPQFDPRLTWDEANRHCTNRIVRIGTLISAPRKAWRLPTVQEFLSLIDPTQAGPALPPDHPFTVQQSVGNFGDYWTATTVPTPGATDQPNQSTWLVNLGNGTARETGRKSTINHTWCVRSPFPTRTE
jgi:hypothetical protein